MKLNDIYKREDFVEFLREEFLPDFNKDIRNIDQRSTTKTIKSAKFLGESKDFDLHVFELETSGKSEKKISQALDSFKLLKEYQSYRALVAYYSDDDQNWRLALLQMTPDVTEKGKIAHKFSNPRRYSFLLGPTAKTKTPEKYLIKDGKVKDFEDLQRRFSVEVVNKDFYKEIARFFIRLVGGDTKLGSKTEHFNPELTLPSVDPNDHQTYQEYSVRLIGRIIFCWFLKQKKSQEDVSLLPEEFLSSEAVRNTEDYYHSILEPIFFEVLNKPKESRKSQFRNGYDKIPYLNGGLFDPHHDDYYEGQPSFALKIPNDWFKELFEVLETYNFTIDENTSLDVDLSIDPEMLGRIFENLLAEINPETGESARKSTGSYYTPRQIVEYMVDQSLLQYLLTKTEIDKSKLEALISVDSADDEQFPLSDEEKRKVVNALDEVKIIDPACGSGAFPIGILQKIVWILGKVDTNGRLWFDKKLEGLDPLLHEDFKQKFQNENFDYIRKTGVIRDSIYGVDIQPIAVEVSKLRSFLTLIVDEDINEEKDNRGIKPLPNLEFKFVAANSLLSLPEAKSRQVGMFEDTSEIEQLKKLRDRYFVSNGFDKEKIKSKFKDVQKTMFKKQMAVLGQGHLTMALADWDPFEDEASGWFDPEWMFGLKYFDIAIANPPYVRVDDIDKVAKEEYKTIYKTAVGKYDLYYLFFEKSLELLSNHGLCVFITPNKYCAADSAIALRNHFLNNASILEIASVSNIKVFSDVSNYPIITTLSKEIGKKTTIRRADTLDELLNMTGIFYEADKKIFSLLPYQIIPINIPAHEFDLITSLYSKTTKLDRYLSISEGLRISKSLEQDCVAEYKITKQYQFERYSKVRDGSYITTENINKILSKNSDRYKKIHQEKILIAEDALRIEATLDQQNTVPQGGVYFATCINSATNIYALLGILNSNLLSKVYQMLFSGMHMGGGYLRYRSKFLECLPSPELNSDDSNSLSNFVKEILSNPDNATNFEKEIDEFVYKIYNLTDSEKEIIKK